MLCGNFAWKALSFSIIIGQSKLHASGKTHAIELELSQQDTLVLAERQFDPPSV